MSVWPSDGLWLEPMWTKALVFHKGEEQLLELEKDVTASDCVCSQPVLEVLGWEEVTMHSTGSHSNSNLYLEPEPAGSLSSPGHIIE